MNTSQIEEVLRHAPRPQAPPGLKGRLRDSALVSMPGGRSALRQSGSTWLSRWWPALAPAAITVACAAALTVQQLEINRLRKIADNAAQVLPGSVREVAEEAQTSTVTPETAGGSTDHQQQGEIARLEALCAKLTREIAQLEQQRAEAVRLRGQLAAQSAAVLSPDELAALDQARQKALRIQCANNLKQLGLAVRVWALDNGDMTPPNFLAMTNEMGTPKILVCPAETGRKPAADWGSFSSANVSYEYLMQGVPEDDPTRVLFRCPVHGHVCLCDGSVQSGVAKEHPEWLVTRDGKLYFHMQAPDSPDARQ